MGKLTLCHQVLCVGVYPVNCLEFVERGEAIGGAVASSGNAGKSHLAQHATLFTDPLGQGSGVDAIHGGNALLLEPCAQGGGREEVGEVLAAVRSGNKTGNVNLGRLKVGRQVAEQLVQRLPRRDTIVSD